MDLSNNIGPGKSVLHEIDLASGSMQYSSGDSMNQMSKMSSVTHSSSLFSKRTDRELLVNLDLNVPFVCEDAICDNSLCADDKNGELWTKFDLNATPTAETPESIVTDVSPFVEGARGSCEMSLSHRASAVHANCTEPSSSVLCVKPFSSADTTGIVCIYSLSNISNIYDVPCTAVTGMRSPVACSSGAAAIPRPSNANSKTCQIPGCGKGARGASGCCIAHGGGRRCQKPGCLKGAEGRTVYCKAHGGGRRCQHLGCTKSAEGRTEFCIAHGGGNRCKQEGCARAARGKSGFCIKHGGGKRCIRENCSRSAEGFRGLCISHGGGKRCQALGCSKGAQGSTKFCKAHGGGKRCTFAGCTKGAEGSTAFCKAHGGGKRCSFEGGGVCPKSVHGGTLFCVAHGGGKRCSSEGCTKSARGGTKYCVRHGGGKRCKAEGCEKSAQGSTDFCKAHGGGRRCSWGQPASSYGTGDARCDKFARSKSGLCAAHSALVEDRCVRGGGTLGPPSSQYPAAGDRAAVETSEHGESGAAKRPRLDLLPEGRVHGGSLISFLFAGGSGMVD